MVAVGQTSNGRIVSDFEETAVLSDGVTKRPLVRAEVEVDEVAVLTSDLQRVQAEYSNYRKRVDRDRITANEITTAIVLSEFLPVLDDISRAEEHGELTGGFKAVADQLQAITTKLGLTKFSDVDVPFDPNIHEALMHATSRCY